MADDDKRPEEMQQNIQQSQADGGPSAEKDPKDWVTGDEPATPAQKSYLSTMAVEAQQSVPEDLSKADASKMIEELQEKTGRDTSTERP